MYEIKNINVAVIEDDGRSFVSYLSLKLHGYENWLDSFSILRLNDKFYEIQGIDKKKRRYWIEEIPLEVYAK